MRRFIALVLCIALCFGLFAVPAFAASTLSDKLYTVVNDVFAWLDSALFNGSSVHGGGQHSSPFGGGGRYSDFVTTLPSSVYGSDTYPVYMPNMTYNSGSLSFTANVISGPGSFSFSGIKADDFAVRYVSQAFTPVCYGQIGFSCNVNIIDRLSSFTIGLQYQNADGTWSAIADSRFFSGTSVGTYSVNNYSSGTLAFSSSWFCQFRLVISIIPYSSNSSSTVSITNMKFYQSSVSGTYSIPSCYTSDNRMYSVLPYVQAWNTSDNINKYYYGTVVDGTVTNVYETNIFNEETNVFTVPGETPVTYNITNWNYDYSTRTYNCTDGTNNYIVTYGDDHITVTVPDGSGGTTSTNYYYVHQTPVPTPAVPGSDTSFPGASSDNFEDDPNTTGGFFSTVWKAFKDGLASLIAGIIKGLFKGIKALIDGITSVFSDLVSGFFGFVTSFFNSFGTGPGAVGQFFGGGVVDLG